MTRELLAKIANDLFSRHGNSYLWTTSVNELEQFAARIIELETPRILAQQWQPIETAPERGSFFVYMPDEREGKRIQLAVWHENVKIIGNCFAFDMRTPTHWMQLPAAPEPIK